MTGVSQVMQGIEGALGVSSAAIRCDGRLWTWGCNGTGMAGHRHDRGRRYPNARREPD